MEIFQLNCDQLIPRPLEEVFSFFADPRNLQGITPPWLRFEILDPEGVEMRVGALIDYRLRVHLIPLRWRSEITVWEPPHRFVDEQRRGPYRMWRHEHLFEERDGRTLIGDRLRYALLGGRLIHKLFVARDVEKIFAFRRRELERIFPSQGNDR